MGHEEGWPPCPESVALLCLLWTAPLPSPPGFRAWPPVRESLPGPTAQPRRPGSPSRPADTSALCGQLHVLGHSSPGSWRGVSGVLGSLSWHARSRRLANCWGHLFSDENLACGPSLFGPSSCGADGAAGPQQGGQGWGWASGGAESVSGETRAQGSRAFQVAELHPSQLQGRQGLTRGRCPPLRLVITPSQILPLGGRGSGGWALGGAPMVTDVLDSPCFWPAAAQGACSSCPLHSW